MCGARLADEVVNSVKAVIARGVLGSRHGYDPVKTALRRLRLEQLHVIR